MYQVWTKRGALKPTLQYQDLESAIEAAKNLLHNFPELEVWNSETKAKVYPENETTLK